MTTLARRDGAAGHPVLAGKATDGRVSRGCGATPASGPSTVGGSPTGVAAISVASRAASSRSRSRASAIGSPSISATGP